MLGLFLAFGVDVIVIVAALWYVGRVPTTTVVGTTSVILGAFSLWVVVRWVRLRQLGTNTADATAGMGATPADGAETDGEPDPVERLKRRYADGEVSDEEFERRLDHLLDADSWIETGEFDATESRTRTRESE